MKIFTQKSIWKKAAMILIMVTLFEFIITNPALAVDDILEGGGKLLKPIFSLLVTFSDGIINILHSSIMGIDGTLIDLDTTSSWWSAFVTIIGAIIVAACVIGFVILTGGVGTVFATGALIATASVLTRSNIFAKLADGVGNAVVSQFVEESLPETLYLPVYYYRPEEIFKSHILLFNVNFFREPIKVLTKTKTDNDGNEVISYYYYEDENGEDLDLNDNGVKGDPEDTKGYITFPQDSGEFLQQTISSWYNAIRNICLVLMLSVLVYIGIRIMLSSVASDKAKYQTMLKDWLIGLCLLFFTHYIMAFSVTIVEKFTDIVSTSVNKNMYMCIIPHTDQLESDLNEKLGIEESLRIEPTDATQGYAWPSNLMGYLRLKVQLNTSGWQYVGEAIMFLCLTIFTVMFTFTYLRRLLHLVFLTILAPLVSLTYCIDKLNDGQAQGFNKWFKEYVFNLLIQPLHLLLYYILVTSAFNVMGKNILYSIVAIGFLLPAEKLLRSLFGFEKAQTAPAIGPAGAMMASTALSQLLNRGKKGKDGENSKGGKSDDESLGKTPNPRELRNPMDSFSEDNGSQEDDRPSEVPVDDGQDDNQRDPIMDRYSQEGFDQNTDGEYYNPWTDEYDANYNPHNDNYYAPPESDQEDRGETPPIDNTSSPQEQSLEEQIEKPQTSKKQQKLKKIRRAIGRKAHAYKVAGKVALRNLPKKSIRTVGKVAAGIAVGSLAAGASIAVGMATGDASNVAKMGATSAMGGFAIGSGMIKQGPLLKPQLQEAYNQAYNSHTYKGDAMNDYVKKYKKNQNNRIYFEEALGKKETKELFQKGGDIEKYLNHGITDKKDIKALYKLQKEKIVKDAEQAISVSQLGQMIGEDTNHLGKEKREDWKERLEEMAEKSGVKNKKSFATKRLEEIDKWNEFKNK